MRILLLLACGLLVCGCSKAKPVVMPSMKGGAATAPAASPAPEEPGAAGAKPAVAGAKPGGAKPRLDPAEGESELFSIAPSAQDVAPRYAVEGEGKTHNTFAMKRMPEGKNSSDFVIASAVPPAETLGSITQTLPAGFSALPEYGASSDGWPLRIRGDADAAEMVFVPGGVSTQGVNGGPANAGPEHRVMLDPFYIDVYEVTAAQYEAFRSGVSSKRRIPPLARQSKNPREPALGMSWGDANGYAKWVEKQLPTEAQWERAARGLEGFSHPWGNGVHVWPRTRVPGQLELVGAFPTDQSFCGAVDMAGNAREWCADFYSETYYQPKEAKNPTGPKTGGSQSLRVVKGNGPDWAVWARTGVPMSEHPLDVGFRCVLVPAPPAPAKKT